MHAVLVYLFYIGTNAYTAIPWVNEASTAYGSYIYINMGHTLNCISYRDCRHL